mmetsp:Transcript_18176/g.31913  ORF Transcript_18176/g.31913 Transcript_18176/m.31913 type:complete len:461 (+) Transcript_18176:65-1447(+)
MRTRIKNTFLEFCANPDADGMPDLDDVDGLQHDGGFRRQFTDSVVDRSPSSLEWEAQKVDNPQQMLRPKAPNRLINRRLDSKGDMLNQDSTGLAFRQISPECTPGNSSSSSTKAGSEPERTEEVSSGFSRSSTAGKDMDELAEEATEEDASAKRLISIERETAERGGGLSGKTTVMVQNVPASYSQRKLMAELDTEFEGKYDFLYLPLDPRSHTSRGFAFVNMISQEDADAFYERFHGKLFRGSSPGVSEPLVVVPAVVQGFEDNAAQFFSLKAGRRSRSRKGNPVFFRKLPSHIQESSTSLYDEEAQVAQEIQQQLWQLQQLQELQQLEELQKLQIRHKELQEAQSYLTSSTTLQSPLPAFMPAIPAVAPQSFPRPDPELEVAARAAAAGYRNMEIPQQPGSTGQGYARHGMLNSKAPGGHASQQRVSKTPAFCQNCGASRGTGFACCPFCGITFDRLS